MSDLHLRDRLHEEMSGLELPPAGDLVARAEAGGVRTRRVRRTASGLGTVAVVGLTVLAVTAGSQLGTGPASGTAAVQAGSPAVVHAVPKVTAKTVVKPVVAKPKVAEGSKDAKASAAQARKALQAAASAAHPPQWTAAPEGVPATPQGELQLFSELAAPYGTVSHFAVSEDADKTHVRAYLTTADGKVGMLQFSLEHDTLGYAADCLPTADLVSCHTTSDGGYVILADDHAGCVNTADITVVHPDGTAVWITLASCLTDGGNNLHPGTQTLTVAEAERIFQDPGFDFTMPADVVARGAQNLGNLATFW